jgi:hypothetical protein
VTRLGKIALLAPIFSFAREKNAGGRMAKVQVNQIGRWLKRDPKAALDDFYQRSGLDIAARNIFGTDLESLLAGLGELENSDLAPQLPVSWRAWCGEHDALLDAAQLHALEPGVSIVPGATHHPAKLLSAFAKEVS